MIGIGFSKEKKQEVVDLFEWQESEIEQLQGYKNTTTVRTSVDKQYRAVTYFIEKAYPDLAIKPGTNVSGNPGLEWLLRFYGQDRKEFHVGAYDSNLDSLLPIIVVVECVFSLPSLNMNSSISVPNPPVPTCVCGPLQLIVPIPPDTILLRVYVSILEGRRQSQSTGIPYGTSISGTYGTLRRCFLKNGAPP